MIFANAFTIEGMALKPLLGNGFLVGLVKMEWFLLGTVTLASGENDVNSSSILPGQHRWIPKLNNRRQEIRDFSKNHHGKCL